MIDPIRNDITFLPLQFSRNELQWIIPAAITTLTSRADLRYFLDILVPEYAGSTSFSELTTLEGREKPPVTTGGTTTYEGAYFSINEVIDSFLTRQKPTFLQAQPTVINTLTMPYRIRERITGGTPLLNESNLRTTQYIFKGGIGSDDIGWLDRFFTEYLSASRQFLTWQPKTKQVGPTQEEYLFYLINFTPPAELHLRVEVQLRDGSITSNTSFVMTDVQVYSVVSLPTGPQVLNLPDDTYRYSVWLADENNNRISEVRTYYLDHDYYTSDRAILFANSLGGYDTVRFVGTGDEIAQLQRVRAQSSSSYMSRSVETLEGRNVRVKATRSLSVSTGWLKPEALNYLAELAISEDAYLITEKGHVPVLLTANDLKVNEDDPDLISRKFTFEYSRQEQNVSLMPPAPVEVTRQTAWRIMVPQILVDSFGKRTGYVVGLRLRKIYISDGSDVIPIVEKLNIIGDPDYIAPGIDPNILIGSTPYPSIEISITGRYNRSNCPSGYFGGTATIVIPAGRYGSENDVQEANDRARTEANALDTQAYADQYGTCIMLFYNTAISRTGTYNRSNCVTGSRGGPATIMVASGMFSSQVSQVDAQAKAEAEYNRLNTQAYANQYGTCTALPLTTTLRYVSQTYRHVKIAWDDFYYDRAEVHEQMWGDLYGQWAKIADVTVGTTQQDITLVHTTGGGLARMKIRYFRNNVGYYTNMIEWGDG